MSKAQLQQIIESVRDAIEKECWIPALTTALTIPDILGQVEFPEHRRKDGKRNVGKQYMAWVREHVERRYADESGFDENGNAKNPYFTAKMCYALRCNMLHQGSASIKFKFKFEDDESADYSYLFELRINACNSYGATWPSPPYGKRPHKKVKVCIDVKTLCLTICNAGERYIVDTDDRLFEGLGLDLVDISMIGVHEYSPKPSAC